MPSGTFPPPLASILAEKSVKYDVSSDAQLVEAASAGDCSAFGELVGRYQDRLFNTMLRICGSREDAADAVQDAFVQAFVKLGSFRGDAQFYTWLYRIAMNLALSRRRRARPTASLETARADAGEEAVDRHPGPDDRLLAREQAEQVQSALALLAEQHRKILVLREIEGCSYEVIADILELPVGTVRSRLFRARLQLRERLGSLWNEDAPQPG
ncbi:MAG: RNA polymerase subunit sigma-70 [Planctomycetota bacterium]|nr:MAG: RNA polymerase subunit sigma-70 [Planctomycetota bacterium]